MKIRKYFHLNDSETSFRSCEMQLIRMLVRKNSNLQWMHLKRKFLQIYFLLQLFLRHMIDQWLLVNSRKISKFQNLKKERERECRIDSNKVEGKKYQGKKMTLIKYKQNNEYLCKVSVFKRLIKSINLL